ncbi:LytR/AlgR family response regulator transcription factor [Xanthovirga aplysinae]|uniref:LytR/AlgR family response regulator transcription factor n=1 Tax=Xanthovirga aplysinae TaxID=2529853 RepID=UPI0012BD7622|nr:LytTR family DNA-binding domain-containing protein [Xanthovirga aplysinae]MTI32940.1 LytTR family transcriptional regulator [Xanthovirga aplysinae]
MYADKTIYRTNVNDLLYLKAEVDYVKIVTNEKNLLILDSLSNWEKQLATYNFLRVHRSYLINLQKIEKVIGNEVFIGDATIPLGKNYKAPFLKAIKGPFIH